MGLREETNTTIPGVKHQKEKGKNYKCLKTRDMSVDILFFLLQNEGASITVGKIQNTQKNLTQLRGPFNTGPT